MQNSEISFEPKNIFSIRPRTLVYIGGNKSNLTPESAYQTRREILASFKKNDIEIYGKGWKGRWYERIPDRLRSTFFAYRNGFYPDLFDVYRSLRGYYEAALGEIENKKSIYQTTKFALILENSNLFITEKIFDALIAGAVPIYFGPDLESFGIPENIVLRAKPSSEAILNLTKDITTEALESCRIAGYEYISSARFQERFQAEVVAWKVASCIQSRFKVTQELSNR